MNSKPLDKIADKFPLFKPVLNPEMVLVPGFVVLLVAAVGAVLAQKIQTDEQKVQVLNHENAWAVYATEQRAFRRHVPLTVKVAQPSSQTYTYEEFRTLVQTDLKEWNRALNNVGARVSFELDPSQFPPDLCFEKALLLPEDEVRVCSYDQSTFERWSEGRPHRYSIMDLGASTDGWHTVRSGVNVAIQDRDYSADFVQRMVLHELGHVLGLADLETPANLDSVMRAYADQLPLHIDEGTQDGLAYLYGAQEH